MLESGWPMGLAVGHNNGGKLGEFRGIKWASWACCWGLQLAVGGNCELVEQKALWLLSLSLSLLEICLSASSCCCTHCLGKGSCFCASLLELAGGATSGNVLVLRGLNIVVVVVAFAAAAVCVFSAFARYSMRAK